METPDIIQAVSLGFEKAKGGDAVNIYSSIVPYHLNGQLPLKSHYAFGWIIYYALHQSPANSINERKQMLARYLSLRTERPHKLHSMILTEAIRLYKDTSDLTSAAMRNHNNRKDIPHFSIMRFIGLWDLANLRPGDWRRKEHEGKPLPSTVEKLITHCVDELYKSHCSEIDPAFISVVDRAMTEYAASASLYAQRAQLHELTGDTAAAIDMLRDAILTSPAKFFLWQRLACLISDKESVRLKASLLYKALKCPGPEEYKGRIHLLLASAMTEAGAYPQALWELQIVRKLYEEKGWNMPRHYREVESKLPADTQPMDPTAIYRKIEPLADDFIYEALPEIVTQKTYHKPGGSTTDRYGRQRISPVAWRVTDSRGTNYWFSPSAYGIPDQLPTGTPVRIKVFAGKVVKAFINA